MSRYVLKGLLIILYFHLAFKSEAQIIEHLSPLPGSYNLQNSTFISETEGWAIDEYNNKLMHTTNTGKSWKIIYHFKSHICQLKFVDRKHGYVIVEDSSGLFYTNDGGFKWTRRNVPLKPRNYYRGDADRLFVLDENHLWLLNESRADSIVISKDKGLNWQKVKLTATGGSFVEHMQFTDSMHGFIQSGQKVYATKDGGLHWSLKYNFVNIGGPHGIFFHDSIKWSSYFVRYAGNDHCYYKHGITYNSGTNWTYSDSIYYYGVSFYPTFVFADTMNGIMLNKKEYWQNELPDSMILHITNDGGVTWKPILVEEKFKNAQSVSSAGSHGFVASGWYGMLYSSRDAGNTWNKNFFHQKKMLPNHLAMYDYRSGYLVEIDKDSMFLYETNDDCRSWTKASTITTHANYFNTESVLKCFNSQQLFLFSEEYQPFNNYAFFSIDGGKSWGRNLVPDHEAIHINDFNHTWLATTNAIYFLTDTGKSLIKQFDFQDIQNLDYIKLHFMDDNLHGWLFIHCKKTKLYFTTDGGLNWQTVSLPHKMNANEIFFTDSLNGWMIYNKLYRTKDGGNTWTEKKIKSGKNPVVLSVINFSDSMHGWIAGGKVMQRPKHGKQFIAHTVDGGETWITDLDKNSGLEKYEPTSKLNSACFIGRRNAWFYGDGYELFKMTDNFIEPVDGKCSISAYPNPAHVSCTIDLTCFGEEDKQVFFYSETGQLAKKYNVGKSQQLIIENEMLRDGVYNVVAESSGQTAMTKVVILRKKKL